MHQGAARGRLARLLGELVDHPEAVDNDIPLILRDSRPYATCAFVGCWFYLLLVWLQIDSEYSVLLATA
ncbi:hypothetical protein, partial [Streptomyces sp. NPDC005568]|uniref:hypothetical protein n=1 Tax=Streptomyces sp. NPDC005568 TaxID=3156887 RepID=UPI0033B80F56